MTSNKRRIVTLAARFRNYVETIEAAHAEGAGYDAGFDAGEFSGPAHWRAFAKDADQIARRLGFASFDVANAVALSVGVR